MRKAVLQPCIRRRRCDFGGISSRAKQMGSPSICMAMLAMISYTNYSDGSLMPPKLRGKLQFYRQTLILRAVI